MPGTWTAVTSICSSRRFAAFQRCRRWADEGSSQCSAWADHGSNECKSWADHGHNECCTWAPCSWFCDAFYWVAKWVCVAWYWVAKWVCIAWYWVAKWVCLAWEWVFYLFCINGNGGPMFLLTDGTVLLNECAGGYGTRRWWKLTPTTSGNYVNGTWTRVADSNYARKYFASAVFADGRLIVAGGEYSDASGSNSQDETAKTEIYDPVADTWTEIAAPAGVTQIGDSPCCLLPDNRLLLGSFNSRSTFFFDPATGIWTAGPNKGDSGSEETWVLLGEATVLTPQCSNRPKAEKYVIRTNTWTSAGTLAANIVEASSLEIGPGFLLDDGRGFFVGASGGNTALYTAGTADTDVGTWTAGPAIPLRERQNQGSKDGPGAVLPSGTVLFPVAPVDGKSGSYLSPCSFYEFNGTTLTQVTNPPNANCPTYVGRMLVIPTGQVLWAREDDSGIYAYTETTQPAQAAQPAITTCPAAVSPGATVAILGTQFNGLSQAVGYGDDYAAATNYPIVRIHHLESGVVQYCRTANHTIPAAGGGTTPSMGVATGATIVTTEVTIPPSAMLGDAELVVIANGVASRPARITVRL